MTATEGAVYVDISNIRQFGDKFDAVQVRIFWIQKITQIGKKLDSSRRQAFVYNDIQRMLHMRINRFRREYGVSIPINPSDQSIEMRRDKLDVEDAIPAGLIFCFMRPTKV
jgi:hypothetical protein